MLLRPSHRYPAQTQLAGGVCKFVPLRLNESRDKWELDLSALEAKITEKTKFLCLTTPHNVSRYHCCRLRLMIVIMKGHHNVDEHMMRALFVSVYMH